MRGWKAERRIVAGRPRTEALTVFEESLNKRVRHRMRKLKPLRNLLSDPITEDQARALVDVARCRRPIEDLVAWLECPAVTWQNFPLYREYEDQFRRKTGRTAATVRISAAMPTSGTGENTGEIPRRLHQEVPAESHAVPAVRHPASLPRMVSVFAANGMQRLVWLGNAMQILFG